MLEFRLQAVVGKRISTPCRLKAALQEAIASLNRGMLLAR
jgi:hypothetical protein